MFFFQVVWHRFWLKLASMESNTLKAADNIPKYQSSLTALQSKLSATKGLCLGLGTDDGTRWGFYIITTWEPSTHVLLWFWNIKMTWVRIVMSIMFWRSAEKLGDLVGKLDTIHNTITLIQTTACGADGELTDELHPLQFLLTALYTCS